MEKWICVIHISCVLCPVSESIKITEKLSFDTGKRSKEKYSCMNDFHFILLPGSSCLINTTTTTTANDRNNNSKTQCKNWPIVITQKWMITILIIIPSIYMRYQNAKYLPFVFAIDRTALSQHTHTHTNTKSHTHSN